MDYRKERDTLRTANQRLEGERDAILLQARCWAGEAKTQQSITKEVGEILGGIPSWGPIADSVAAIVADRQRLEGEVNALLEALNTAKYRIEQGRVWNGMGWSLTGLHPHGQQKALDAIDAALRGNGVSE